MLQVVLHRCFGTSWCLFFFFSFFEGKNLEKPIVSSVLPHWFSGMDS